MTADCIVETFPRCSIEPFLSLLEQPKKILLQYKTFEYLEKFLRLFDCVFCLKSMPEIAIVRFFEILYMWCLFV